MSLNTLFEFPMKQVVQKSRWNISKLLKKGKTTSIETLHLLTNVYADDNFSSQVPKKKDFASVSKRVHKEKLCNLKSLCNLQELYTAFKEKHPNMNIGFSKSCALRPKWCVLAGSKMTRSVCTGSAHQYVVFLVDAMDWDLTYKDLIKLILPCLNYFH